MYSMMEMEEKNLNKSAFLFLWEGIFLYAGNSIATNTHEHHAIQIIAAKDEPFRMRLLNDNWQYYKSLIINSDQPHECILDSGHVYFLGIDPESIYALKIKKNYLQKSLFTPVPDNLINNFIMQIEKQLKLKIDCKSIFKTVTGFINNLAGEQTIEEGEIDKRVEEVISIIKKSINSKIKLSILAETVHLSETRLVHLFKEQTGIPIRKYILWYKINYAVKEIIHGNNLTEAAHLAGFSDAAHFSRTFRRMFGISAVDMLKNSQNIQAFVCND